jgi:hypothetical protein
MAWRTLVRTVETAHPWIPGTHTWTCSWYVISASLESVHGKTFAKTSAECLEQRMARGIVQDRDERFATNYKLEFNVKYE